MSTMRSRSGLRGKDKHLGEGAKGKEGEDEVEFALPHMVRAGLQRSRRRFVWEPGREEQEFWASPLPWLAGSGLKSAKGISSPPQNCPPNSFPPSGHSSGPDSVPWPLL